MSYFYETDDMKNKRHHNELLKLNQKVMKNGILTEEEKKIIKKRKDIIDPISYGFLKNTDESELYVNPIVLNNKYNIRLSNELPVALNKEHISTFPLPRNRTPPPPPRRNKIVN
jgi:hypothetical protein